MVQVNTYMVMGCMLCPCLSLVSMQTGVVCRNNRQLPPGGETGNFPKFRVVYAYFFDKEMYIPTYTYPPGVF